MKISPSLRLGLLSFCVVCGCGPSLRRDLASMPQRQITYDDLCRLQDHFNQREAGGLGPYRSVSEQSTETSETEPDETGRLRQRLVGEGTYVIATRTDRQRFAQLLREEYQRLPRLRMGGSENEVRVTLGWWGSGSMRRTRPDTDIVVVVGEQRVELPPSPCVGEFLFGQRAYAMRRNVLSAERDRAVGALPTVYLHDAGAGDAGAGDAASR